MKVIVLGCGRVGERVARLMSEEGHDVAVIDYDANALGRLGPNFKGRKIKGVGFDRNVLLDAGIAAGGCLRRHQLFGQCQYRGGAHCPQCLQSATGGGAPLRPRARPKSTAAWAW